MRRDDQQSRNTFVVADERDRLPWVDLARGFCIVLVVMMHFDEIHYTNLDFEEMPKKFWDTLTSVARPARMPTFFVISGFLASRSIDRPITKIWDNRIGVLYYTYIVWSFISISILWLLFREFDVGAARDFIFRFGSELIFPQTQIWFLYSLVAFFAIARSLRRWRVQTLAFAFAFSGFSEWFDDQVLNQIVRLLPYYLTGIYFPKLFLKCADNPSWTKVAVLLVCYAVAMAPLLFFDRATIGIWIPASILGMALILNLARMVVSLPGFSAFELIGRNTLPIYVIHSSALIAINTLANPQVQAIADRAEPVAFAYYYPLIGNAFLIAACLVLHVSLKWLGMGWLFSLPKGLRLENRSRSAEV